MKWCDNSYAIGDEVTFWCDGMALEHHVPREQVSFSNTALIVELAWLLQTLTLTTGRTCGLSIGQGKICDQDEVAFNGIYRGSYSFLLTDQERPVCTDFDAMDGYGYEVPLDGNVNLMWSEPVALNPDPPQATLSQLEYVDAQGSTAVTSSTSFALKAPHAELVSASKLRIHLGGKIRSGMLYSLQLPPGAVQDISGNGCLEVAYRFRAVTDTSSYSDGSGSSGAATAIGLVILVVLVVVACALVIGIALVKLYKLNSEWLTFSKHDIKLKRPQYKTVQSQPIPVGASTKPEPTFANASAAAENAYRAAAAAAERIRENERQEEASSKAGTWAKPSQKANSNSSSGGTWGTGPRAAAQAKVHPGREGFNAGAQRRSGSAPSGSKEKPPSQSGEGAKAQGNGSAGPSAASAPQVESNASPEVKAVEKQLRAMMDQPIDKRKKAFKELLVEYHPDKNPEAHAKDVFQYVNNARGWFLVS